MSPGLSYGVVCMMVCLAVLVQCQLVMDRQAEGQTQEHDNSKCRASIALRRKNHVRTSRKFLCFRFSFFNLWDDLSPMAAVNALVFHGR